MDSVMATNAINVIRSALEDYFDNNISSDDHEGERQELELAWVNLMQYMQYQKEYARAVDRILHMQYMKHQTEHVDL